MIKLINVIDIRTGKNYSEAIVNNKMVKYFLSYE